MTVAPIIPVPHACRPSTADMDAWLDTASTMDTTRCAQQRKEVLSRFRTVRRQQREQRMSDSTAITSDGMVKPGYVLDTASGRVLRLKLLQFWEDVRPPYYGTFSKDMPRTGSTNPFVRAMYFDYSHDSEAEWEPEPEEADLCASDEEDEEEEEADDEPADPDGWMVPHGYLSDDEGMGGVMSDESDDDDYDPTRDTSCQDVDEDHVVEGVDGEVLADDVVHARKRAKRERKLRALEQQQRKQEAGQRPPFSIGPLLGTEAEAHTYLSRYAAHVLAFAPLDLSKRPTIDQQNQQRVLLETTETGGNCLAIAMADTPVSKSKSRATSSSLQSTTTKSKQGVARKATIQESLIPDFIEHIHGSPSGVNALITGFLEKVGPTVPKAALDRKLRDTAFVVKEVRAPYTKPRWFVSEATLKQYDLHKLPLPPAKTV
eukprot:m.305475 g.305475  ORF g.305475 m.305475 type:complete len:431 (-) comp15907_c0_seq12:4120-5412(-)